MDEFVRKYGTRTLGLLVAKFIQLAPEFAGDRELAAEIGRVVGDLETALEAK